MTFKLLNFIFSSNEKTERIRDRFLTYELSPITIFFYSDSGSQRLYFITSHGPALFVVPNNLIGFKDLRWVQPVTAAECLQTILDSKWNIHYEFGSIAAHSKQGPWAEKPWLMIAFEFINFILQDSTYAYHGQVDLLSAKMSKKNLIDVTSKLQKKFIRADSKSIAIIWKIHWLNFRLAYRDCSRKMYQMQRWMQWASWNLVTYRNVRVVELIPTRLTPFFICI